MTQNVTDLLGEVTDYYSQKLAEHGQTPRGVDWNGEQSQELRFAQLGKVINADGAFSINDLGCGYGAFLDYLGSRFSDFSFLGVDVSAAMVAAAQERYQGNKAAEFIVASEPDRIADYTVASGIFNVRQQRSDAEWFDYILKTLDVMNASSARGFSFNCLSSYSDEDKKRDYLYYADPNVLFDWCKRHYAKDVALLHDYGLYEFTLVVRKSL